MATQITKKILKELGFKNVVEIKYEPTILLNGGVGSVKCERYNSLDDLKAQDWLQESDVIIIRTYGKRDWNKFLKLQKEFPGRPNDDAQYVLYKYTFCNWEPSLTWEESEEFISHTPDCLLDRPTLVEVKPMCITDNGYSAHCKKLSDLADKIKDIKIEHEEEGWEEKLRTKEDLQKQFNQVLEAGYVS